MKTEQVTVDIDATKALTVLREIAELDGVAQVALAGMAIVLSGNTVRTPKPDKEPAEPVQCSKTRTYTPGAASVVVNVNGENKHPTHSKRFAIVERLRPMHGQVLTAQALRLHDLEIANGNSTSFLIEEGHITVVDEDGAHYRRCMKQDKPLGFTFIGGEQ